MLRLLWLATLLLAGLGLALGGAHVLELPVKMQYEASLYMQVTSTLYRYFGLVGGPVQVLALLASVVLTWQVRNRVAFRSTLAGAICLGLSLVLWFVLVQDVNANWAQALNAGPAKAVQAYAELRNRWEYGHVAAFCAWIAGFTLLLNGLVREATRGRSHPRHRAEGQGREHFR